MSTISELPLPGVGRKFQIEPTSGDPLIVAIHDDGRRELYRYDRKELGRADSVLTLTDGEDPADSRRNRGPDLCAKGPRIGRDGAR